jgi:hypothetical protein
VGEAKQKRREWVELTPGLPARAAISRPTQRPTSTRQYEHNFAAQIADAAKRGEPALCFNFECDAELLALPATFAFIKAGADPQVPPIAMGVCERCAQRSDAELLVILRRNARHLGFTGPPENAMRAAIEFPGGYQITAGGVPLLVVQQQGEPFPSAVDAFADLLERQSLPRFVALRHGAGNCHVIVHQLYLDLKKLGIDHRFTFKRGASALLGNSDDPDGQHSWIETDGWAIDASNGAHRPVLIMPVKDYYERTQMTAIRSSNEDQGSQADD